MGHNRDMDRMERPRESAIARLTRERDEARAVVDMVAAEVAATLEAYRGGQSAGSPPLPLSVAQRWARTLASAETEEER